MVEKRTKSSDIINSIIYHNKDLKDLVENHDDTPAKQLTKIAEERQKMLLEKIKTRAEYEKIKDALTQEEKEEYKKLFGIKDNDSDQKSNVSTIKQDDIGKLMAFMEMIKQYPTDMQDKLMMMYMLNNMGKSGNDGGMGMMMFALMQKNMNGQQPNQNQDAFLDILKANAVKKMTESDLDVLNRILPLINSLGQKQGGFDLSNPENFVKIMDSYKNAGKAMGLQEPMSAIEDRKIGLEEKRLDNDFKLKRLELDNKTATSRDITGLASAAMGSVFGNMGNNSNQQNQQQVTEQDVECPKCKKTTKIKTDAPDKSMTRCSTSGCSTLYMIDGDKIRYGEPSEFGIGVKDERDKNTEETNQSE